MWRLLFCPARAVEFLVWGIEIKKPHPSCDPAAAGGHSASGRRARLRQRPHRAGSHRGLAAAERRPDLDRYEHSPLRPSCLSRAHTRGGKVRDLHGGGMGVDYGSAEPASPVPGSIHEATAMANLEMTCSHPSDWEAWTSVLDGDWPASPIVATPAKPGSPWNSGFDGD